MYEELVGDLRYCDKGDCNGCRRQTKDTRFCYALLREAADAIEELSKRIDFLMNCIYEAEDALDRGADNDWARAALEKAERGQDDV